MVSLKTCPIRDTHFTRRSFTVVSIDRGRKSRNSVVNSGRVPLYEINGINVKIREKPVRTTSGEWNEKRN